MARSSWPRQPGRKPARLLPARTAGKSVGHPPGHGAARRIRLRPSGPSRTVPRATPSYDASASLQASGPRLPRPLPRDLRSYPPARKGTVAEAGRREPGAASPSGGTVRHRRGGVARLPCATSTREAKTPWSSHGDLSSEVSLGPADAPIAVDGDRRSWCPVGLRLIGQPRVSRRRSRWNESRLARAL